MFTDEFLEKIFSHPEMQKIPIGTQATAVKKKGVSVLGGKQSRDYQEI